MIKNPKDERLLEYFNKLKNNFGKSIVLSDSNDKETQIIVNSINQFKQL